MKPFGLMKRKSTGVFYWRADPSSWYRSTGCTRKGDAMRFAEAQLRRIEAERQQKEREVRERERAVPLRAYLEPFYRWGSCPHLARLLDEKKQIGRQHAAHQRALIDRYVLRDAIADKNVREIRRGDVLDLRRRLLEKTSDRQANRVLGVLRTCIREGLYRQELEQDPTAGIGNIRHQARERGTFSSEELAALFPAEGLGPWADLQAFTCFLIAAGCGLRRGELLALRWSHVDFEGRVLHVLRAWKDETTLGPPKWGRTREVPLPEVAAKVLRELRANSLHVLPPALVFSNGDGSRLSTRWWQETFRAGMKAAKIDAAGRNLTAHSFRHSLNTALRDRGVPDEKIRAAMGWSSEKVQAGYTHFGAEHLRDLAGQVDAILKRE